MKISFNDIELFTLNETKKKVIMDEISEDIFEQDMKRRLQWVLEHKYEQCFKRLKEQWDVKFAENGVESIPVDKDAYARLVFTQGNYKNRKARDAESPIAVK